jgi:hypothetical protein
MKKVNLKTKLDQVELSDIKPKSKLYGTQDWLMLHKVNEEWYWVNIKIPTAFINRHDILYLCRRSNVDDIMGFKTPEDALKGYSKKFPDVTVFEFDNIIEYCRFCESCEQSKREEY